MKMKIISAKKIYNSKTEDFYPDNCMLIVGEKIRCIGSLKHLKEVASQAEILDWNEYYLFPSLINTHVHLEFDTTGLAREHYLETNLETRLKEAEANAKKLLGSGVTTVRDAGSSWNLLRLRGSNEYQRGELPYIQFAGPPLTVSKGHLYFLGCETDTEEEMLREVRIRKEKKCDAVKLIVTGGQMTPGSLPEKVSLSTDQIKMLTKAAHKMGLPTIAHCLTTEAFENCMYGGVDCIEHIACFIRNVDNQLLERVYMPEIMNQYCGDHRYFMMGLSAGYHNLDDYREGKKICSERENFLLEQEERMFRIFQYCIELGLIPVCGTDAGTGGTKFEDTWLEIALMVERGGLSNRAAIKIGTVNSAKCLGIQTGSLETDAYADIVALTGNPLESIREYRNPEQVICRGTLKNK